MNRALRAAAMSVLLLSPVALTACSAGQVAQTAEQDRDQSGGTATVGDLTIRDAQLAYPPSGEHAAGSDPRLIVAVSNTGQEDDTLLDITGEGFASAELVGSAATPAPAGTPASTGLDIPIPAGSTVFIGGEGPAVALTDLDEPLTVGQALDVTMSFEEAGDIEVSVLVDTPTRDLPRGDAFDFHEEEGGEGHSGGSASE
ncbi:copper chaperone PCu(A)C [Modestobacter lapidis]|nr:copper chaperone PCu(A)C [Modestobacter lapidis]